MYRLFKRCKSSFKKHFLKESGKLFFSSKFQLRLLGKNVNNNMKWHKLMEKYENEVRRAFTLKKKFIQGAVKRINRVKEKFLRKKKLKSNKDLIYVGVHIR